MLSSKSQNLKAYLGDDYKHYGYKTESGKVAVYADYLYDYAEDFSNGWGLVRSFDRFSFINAAGKTLPMVNEYNWIYPFSDGLAAVNKGAVKDEIMGTVRGGKWGFINTQGKEVIALQYEAAGQFKDGLAWVKQAGKYGCIDKTGKTIIPFSYDDVKDFKDGFAAVNLGAVKNKIYYIMSGGLWGFVDTKGTSIVLPQFTQVEYFSNGLALVELNGGNLGDGKFGFINTTGKITIASNYDDAHSFSGGLAAINEGAKKSPLGKSVGKWGFIDNKGKKIIPCKYDKVLNFVNGYCVVANNLDFYGNGLYGMIDATGKEIIVPGKYDYIFDIPQKSDDAIVVTKGKKYGLISARGIELVAPQYDFMLDMKDGTYRTELKGLYGYLDKTGKEIVPAKFKKADKWQDGYVHVVKFSTEQGYYNVSGAESVPLTFIDTILGIREDIMLFKNKGIYGFYNIAKTKLCKKPYQEAYFYHNGLAPVKDKNKWGFINADDDVAIPLQYDAVRNYEEGMAAVNKGATVNSFGMMQGGKWGFANAAGKEMIALKYDDAGDFSEGLAPVNIGGKPDAIGLITGGKWGFVDKTGKEVIPLIYSSMGIFVNGIALVELNGKKILIDKTGKEVK
jgi:hypothetical protein